MVRDYQCLVWIRKRVKMINCACGCGILIPDFDNRGRARRFVHGHQSVKSMDEEMENILILDNGCWEWQGKLNNSGYGPHKRIYEKYYGAVPIDRELCHSCDYRPCVNPFHLFVGTTRENVQDAINKGRPIGRPKKQYCSRGHPMIPNNLRYFARPDGSLGWQCLTCRRANGIAYRQRYGR